MLFKILKLFGLDVPAKIEAAKASFELRVEQATDHVKQVARQAAVVAVLSAFAAVSAAMAVGVGLIALYRWMADVYGPYVGFGVIGAILVVVTAILAIAAAIRVQALASDRIKLPRYAVPADVASEAGVIMSPAAEGIAAQSYADPHSWPPPIAPAAPIASAGDLVEPLSLFLSKFVKYPSVGNPVLDELIGNFRATAHGTADEAVACAANVVRHGNRANLLLVLTGAALGGWLLSHHARK